MGFPADKDGATARLMVAVGVAAAIGIPLLIIQRYVASTRGAAMAMVAVFLLVAGVVVFVAVRGRPRLRLPVAGTYVAILLGVVVAGYWTGFRDRSVDEDVAVAAMRADASDRRSGLAGRETPTKRPAPGPVELAAGGISGADGHAARGKAAVVRRPDATRVLTLTGFDADPGPDVRVYLVPGDGSDISDRIDLGALKGNTGNQQYAIGAGADLSRYGTLVLWCRPFTTRIAVARLR